MNMENICHESNKLFKNIVDPIPLKNIESEKLMYTDKNCDSETIALVYTGIPYENIFEFDEVEDKEQNPSIFDIPDDTPIKYNQLKYFFRTQNLQEKKSMNNTQLKKLELLKENPLSMNTLSTTNNCSPNQKNNLIGFESEFENFKSSRSSKSIKCDDYRKLAFTSFISNLEFKEYLLQLHREINIFPQREYLNFRNDLSIQLKRPFHRGISKTLFLDLDETLIHLCKDHEKCQKLLIIEIKDGRIIKLRLNIRPFALKFLKKVSKYYQIYIFTSSTYHYANIIVNFIDPEGKYISGILDRSYCSKIHKTSFKDLSIVKNRNLKDVLIVDNLPHNFLKQISNGIPVSTWRNNPYDQELHHLSKYLIEGADQDDLAKWNESNLNLKKLQMYKEEEIRNNLIPLTRLVL